MINESIPEAAVSKEHLTKVLNQHGFNFQYAVIRAIARMSGADRWAWALEGIEVPVEVRGESTHVDFLLKHRAEPAYLVGECKRANPKLSNWCFFKAPYVISCGGHNQILVEVVNNFDGNKFMAGMDSRGPGDLYHIPFELKTRKEGDPYDKGRGAIDEAVTQVLRHLNGFVDLISRARPYLRDFRRAYILPAIFTTAKLFTCDADLASADILDGTLDLESSVVKEVPWLYYQYNQSPRLKHEVVSQHRVGSLGEFITTESCRTVAIVSSSGIERFLEESALLW